MKTKLLRPLVRFKWWADTEKGERTIVRTLTILMILGIINVSLLIIGSYVTV